MARDRERLSLSIECLHESRKFNEWALRPIVWVDSCACSLIRSVSTPDRGSSTVLPGPRRLLRVKPVGAAMVTRKRSITRNERSRTRDAVSAGRSLFDILHVHDEPAIGICHHLPHCIRARARNETDRLSPVPSRPRRPRRQAAPWYPHRAPVRGKVPGADPGRCPNPRAPAPRPRQPTRAAARAHGQRPEPSGHRPPRGVTGVGGRTPRLCSSKRISSSVSGSPVGGKSWALLSIAMKVLKASARSS